MDIEWLLVGKDRFHAQYEGMFLILYLDKDLISDKSVWCWVLRDQHYHGLNGGCDEAREVAQEQIETKARIAKQFQGCN